MKNMRKLLAIVLCLLLVTTSFATVSAEEGEFSGIVSKTVEVSENGDVEVLIDIAGNPGITALKLWVTYDPTVLTLEENGITDTGLLVGKVQNTFIEGGFPLSWQHSDATAANNYKNGTIAILRFKMKEGFYGTTNVIVDVNSAQSFVNEVFIHAPAMDSGIISVSRDRLAIDDGVVNANGLAGETLVVACYEGEVMTDYKLYPNSEGNVEIRVSDVLDTNGATKVKAFLWTSLETITPVCECIEEAL